MVLVDRMGHLVSDTSWEELHQFARNLGLKQAWFQVKPSGINHYDLTTSRMQQKAVEMGAIEVHPFIIIKAIRRVQRRERNAELRTQGKGQSYRV
jgi:hypothetical protein